MIRNGGSTPSMFDQRNLMIRIRICKRPREAEFRSDSQFGSFEALGFARVRGMRLSSVSRFDGCPLSSIHVVIEPNPDVILGDIPGGIQIGGVAGAKQVGMPRHQENFDRFLGNFVNRNVNGVASRGTLVVSNGG